MTMTFPDGTPKGDFTCPYCQAANDASTGVTTESRNSQPTPGDVTMCMECGCISIFDDDLRLRLPTDEEKAEMDDDPFLIHLRTTWIAQGEK